MMQLAAAAACLAGTGAAHANLGGTPDSVQSDARALHGVVMPRTTPAYDIFEIQTDSGLVIREYQSRDGLVFAVAWTGPAVPDLGLLLGDRIKPYRQAAAAAAAAHRRGLHRAARVATADAVVEWGGHMRSYAGRAYLPAALPAGTSAAELR